MSQSTNEKYTKNCYLSLNFEQKFAVFGIAITNLPCFAFSFVGFKQFYVLFFRIDTFEYDIFSGIPESSGNHRQSQYQQTTKYWLLDINLITSILYKYKFDRNITEKAPSLFRQCGPRVRPCHVISLSTARHTDTSHCDTAILTVVVATAFKVTALINILW